MYITNLIKIKNMAKKIAINGFGRIGRQFLKVVSEKKELEVVAINDLGDVDNLAYLLKYDSAQKKWDADISVEKEGEQTFLVVNGRKIRFISEREPVALPWASLEVDIVVEATGFFTKYEDAKAHIEAGAKRVVISAPGKGYEGDFGKTILMGINDGELNTCSVSSNGSCTTNATSPVAQIMSETVGVEKAFLNTIHGYTATQKIVDGPDAKDWRKGRAAAQNIIPSTTGAAISVTKAVKELKGKFDGVAMRVPVVSGSIADFTFLAKRDTSVEELQEIFKNAAKEERWQGIFTVSDEQLVSTDIIGTLYASIVDLSFIKVVDGNLVKVLAWYDNEMGYTYSLVKHVVEVSKLV